jgi:simple sugar transport system permease protein
MNTGILLSGYKPEFNLVLKAVVVLAVLLVQSPSVSLQRLWRRRKS